MPYFQSTLQFSENMAVGT